MQNKHMFKIALSIGLAAALCSGTAIAGPGTTELWNTDKVTLDLTDTYKLGFEQEFRFAEGSMHYEHSDAGLTRKLIGGLSTSLRYRNIVEFDDDGKEMEHRPHGNLTAKVKLPKGLSLKNNVRLEYRIRDGKDNNLRFRDKGTLKWKWGRLGTYVSDEIFVEKGAFIRNRLYFGMDGQVSKYFKLGAFYMRRTQEKDNWDATHIVGLKLAFTPSINSQPTQSTMGAIVENDKRTKKAVAVGPSSDGEQGVTEAILDTSSGQDSGSEILR